LKEAVEAYCVKHATQKITKAKAREEAKKWRLAEEKDKRKWIEYLQQLQDKVLAKDIAFLGGNEVSQVTGSK